MGTAHRWAGSMKRQSVRDWPVTEESLWRVWPQTTKPQHRPVSDQTNDKEGRERSDKKHAAIRV